MYWINVLEAMEGKESGSQKGERKKKCTNIHTYICGGQEPESG